MGCPDKRGGMSVKDDIHSGSIDFFNAAYEKTYPILLRYALIKARRITDAEDLLQNTYSRFYERICRTGYADIRDVRAFLVKLMNRELAQYYGFLTRRKEQPYAEVPEKAVRSAEEAGIAACLIADVWEGLRQLSPVSQKIFLLYYGLDMPVAEIAASLSMGTEAVKSRLHRARQHIKQQTKTEETV